MRNQVEGSAHLFDMPSPHPSQNRSVRGRQSKSKRGNTMSVCKYIHYLSGRTGPISDGILNSYVASNDSDALI